MSANHFFSFLAGAAAGAAVAWLLSSEKGQETLTEIKDKASAGVDELGDTFEDLKDKAKATAKAAVETVEDAIKQQS